MKGTRSRRHFVEPEQLPSLLRAAASLDYTYRPIARPLLETLAFGGLRISEALSLEWCDVSLGSRTLRVREAKTDGGYREVANRSLAEAGIDPIVGAGFHGLRRTFASLRLALGDDIVYVAQQLGHEDPTFTIKVYARVVRRREKLSGEALRANDEAMKLAQNGRMAPDPRALSPVERAALPATARDRAESC